MKCVPPLLRKSPELVVTTPTRRSAGILRILVWAVVGFFGVPIILVAIAKMAFSRSTSALNAKQAHLVTQNANMAGSRTTSTPPAVDSKQAQLDTQKVFEAEVEFHAQQARRIEEARQLEISNIVCQIEDVQGEDRKVLLLKLFAMDNATKEFPEEIAQIRKLVAEVNDFVRNGAGKEVPFDKWNVFGIPTALEGTGNKYFIGYLPAVNVSFVSEKKSRIVLFVGYGKSSASDFRVQQETSRKALLQKGFSAWDGSHKKLTEYIKESMNDPSSYDHAATVYQDMDEYLVVTTTFRGKNAFGAIVKNSVRAKVDVSGNILEIIE